MNFDPEKMTLNISKTMMESTEVEWETTQALSIGTMIFDLG